MIWTGRKFLPGALRMKPGLRFGNLISGIALLGLGLQASAELPGWFEKTILPLLHKQFQSDG